MGIVIREYQTEDVTVAITIWNQVVEDGVAFPQEENLTEHIQWPAYNQALHF